jgi:hypothetical protein
MTRDNQIMLEAWITMLLWVVGGIGVIGGIVYLVRTVF